MISLLGRLDADLVFTRRTQVLADIIGTLIPADASVLDVGCGDGTIAALVKAKRPGLEIEGIDIMVRPNPKIAVTRFDGSTLPFAPKSKDVVLFVDVLHHTLDPGRLVDEATRVARKAVIIKDHTANTKLDHSTLSLMDWVGNAPHGVVLPYNYLSDRQWHALFTKSGLTVLQSVDRRNTRRRHRQNVTIAPQPAFAAETRKFQQRLVVKRAGSQMDVKATEQIWIRA